jgi:hypothetical protein
MAITTAGKRRAISGIPLPLAPGVTPNYEKDTRWRYRAAYGTRVDYSDAQLNFGKTKIVFENNKKVVFQ